MIMLKFNIYVMLNVDIYKINNKNNKTFNL
jgi:hypothetical protein